MAQRANFEDTHRPLGLDRDALGRPLVVHGDPVVAQKAAKPLGEVLPGWLEAVSVKGRSRHGISEEGLRALSGRGASVKPSPA